MTIRPRTTCRIGLISDTHGLLRREAMSYLQGSDFIVHAGDIGDAAILRQLEEIAPVTAVRGNNDHGPWAAKIPDDNVLGVGDKLVYVLHDLATLAIDPAAAGFHVVVAGHSHRPAAEHRAGVLYLNPGSAGPRRFKLPISIGSLRVSRDTLTHELIEITEGMIAKS
jgi:uncharacterized protein